MPGKLRHSCAKEPCFGHGSGKSGLLCANEPIFANDMRLFWAWPGEDIRRGLEGGSGMVRTVELRRFRAVKVI